MRRNAVAIKEEILRFVKANTRQYEVLAHTGAGGAMGWIVRLVLLPPGTFDAVSPVSLTYRDWWCYVICCRVWWCNVACLSDLQGLGDAMSFVAGSDGAMSPVSLSYRDWVMLCHLLQGLMVQCRLFLWATGTVDVLSSFPLCSRDGCRVVVSSSKNCSSTPIDVNSLSDSYLSFRVNMCVSCRTCGLVPDQDTSTWSKELDKDSLSGSVKVFSILTVVMCFLLLLWRPMARSPSAIKQMLLDWCKAMTREYDVCIWGGCLPLSLLTTPNTPPPLPITSPLYLDWRLGVEWLVTHCVGLIIFLSLSFWVWKKTVFMWFGLFNSGVRFDSSCF